MTTAHDPVLDDLLERLDAKRRGVEAAGNSPAGQPSIATLRPADSVPPVAAAPIRSDRDVSAAEARMGNLINRLSSMVAEKTGGSKDVGRTSVEPVAVSPSLSGKFVPIEPRTLEEAKLGESEVMSLVLKCLLKQGITAGREIAGIIRLPFLIVQGLLSQMKQEHWIVYKSDAGAGDFHCELTTLGREQARRIYEHCSFCGAAPVDLRDYIAGVQAQSITRQRPELADLERAFADLLLSPRIVSRVAQAIRSGRGLFLHGPPGNGKTSIAERIALAFGQDLWIPRSVGVDGEIIRLYDPCCHEELPTEQGGSGPKVDGRWIRIRRPTVLVGGELTMDRLEVTLNKATGISEASVQMKSNCGTLVIDDFGRQRMNIDELLNRWIVPLEKRYDYLNLPSGRTIQVPFDQLIVFSTNLEPRSLADEAFLRRIPYKIDVCDPTEDQFRELFRRAAPKLGIEFSESAVDHLIQKHYREAGRPLRSCQPRDLLHQVLNYCDVYHLPPMLTPEGLDTAVENYFSIL